MKLSRTWEVFVPSTEGARVPNRSAQSSSHVLHIFSTSYNLSCWFQVVASQDLLIYVRPNGTLFYQQRDHQNNPVPLLPLPVENYDYISFLFFF